MTRPLLQSNYFTDAKENIQFVSTGCTVLDCALGGGWALGRIANIVGDKSTSKSGISYESITNFLRKYPEGRAAYRDCEAAFDPEYAQAMGMPIDKVDFGPEEALHTVEQFAADVTEFAKGKGPGIYVLDSLDALSDDAEMKRELGEATYGANKAKALSELFRKQLPSLLADSNTLLLVVSQVRDNIGAMFGEKHKRSGGRALDFYASQVVWLAHVGTIKKTIKKVQRTIGIEVRAKVKKNKVGIPFREADYPYLFGYGVDDLTSMVEWLDSVGKLKDKKDEVLKRINALEDYASYTEALAVLSEQVKSNWAEIETGFMPTRRKYA